MRHEGNALLLRHWSETRTDCIYQLAQEVPGEIQFHESGVEPGEVEEVRRYPLETPELNHALCQELSAGCWVVRSRTLHEFVEAPERRDWRALLVRGIAD